MKKTIFITTLLFSLGSSTLFAQFLVKDTFFETQGVSNAGVISGYEVQAGPYSLWNPDENTFEQIGGAAPGNGVGGAARFSEDGNLLSGTSYINVTIPTEWEKLNTGFNYIFKDVEFPDNQSSLGFAAGETVTYNGDGIVIITYDGGDNWYELWTGIGQGIESMSFPSSYTGYVGGWNEYFAKTTDGGYSWTPQTPGTDVYIYTGIKFKDDFNGVVTAQTNTGVGVYTTNDGGDTWTTGSGLSGVPYKLTYVEGDTYYLVTNSGDIQKSVDNGLNWTTVFSGGGLLLGIEFYNASIGIATGENNIYLTTDGGITWVGQEVMPGALWRDIAWLDQDHITLVGTPELIFASEDGGMTWPIDNLDTTTFNEALYEVIFTANGTGYILGSQGVMFRKASETNAYSVQSLYNVTNNEWTVLGDFEYPVDNDLSSGYNISADGSTVVGSAWVEPNPDEPGLATHATAWTSATGLIDLGSLYSDINRSTRANAVNEDGSIIVGWQDFNGPWKSAVWRKDANGDYLPNEYLLIDPNGDPTDEFNQLGEARAISADGNWIGGQGDYANNNEPWLWSETTGYMSLGTLAANGTGYVTGINRDGTIAVGFFQVGPFDPNIPFIWTVNGGIQNLNTFVTDVLGFDMAASPVFNANAISPNGKYIAGWGYDPTIGQFGDLFTFRLQLPTAPTNDSCVDAIALECGDLVTNSTIFGTDTGGNGSPDVFYSYTGNGGPEIITLNACGPETTFATTVRVYSDCDLTDQIAFNDSSCENQTELTFISDGSTTYIIMVEGYDSNSSGNFQLALSCEEILGSNSFENKTTVLHPNPVKELLHITTNNNVDHVSVYTVAGAEVISKVVSDGTTDIDFSSLANGVYFVKTSSNNTIETFKIIKE